METAQRNALYNIIVRCRSLLEEDFLLQLEGEYGVHADGSMEAAGTLGHLDAVGKADQRAIAATLQHFRKSDPDPRQAVARFVRESAFTFLNRLAAVKLMEHDSRALFLPAVEAGEQSRGFKQFSMVSPQAVRAQPDGGYRLYLELLFDDLSQSLGSIFDRSLPISLFFPTQPCLQDLLRQLNDPSLQAIWGEDETIGWVYQYFTPGELRDQARKASSAPRTSYELAFRNQFYTPRYVVAFLADNTLGRLWWEMRQGDTAIADQCKAMIRRGAPSARPKRDPRSLRILDPAVGSAHFLLYCFDLLLVIYREAYADRDLGPALQQDYPDAAAFQRAIPGLILAHNLHGIDIDRRASQIATLALWLRAQRAYKELGLKVHDRPPIRRINVVDAEPMPGEYDLLGEFVRDLRPIVLGNLLLTIWDKMRLAGEAGSLLKIEKDISEAIEKAKRALTNLPESIQLSIFSEDVQHPLRLNPVELNDKAFWDEAEERVVEALKTYASQAMRSQDTLRRLFASDAMQGMAFIDLLQQTYDVILMNPPFGAASLASKEYIAQVYPRTKNDLYAVFVERGLELLNDGGYLGAITSRTGFFLTSFQKWREEILLKEATLIAMADLGYGVLDTAMVETAAYVLEK